MTPALKLKLAELDVVRLGFEVAELKQRMAAMNHHAQSVATILKTVVQCEMYDGGAREGADAIRTEVMNHMNKFDRALKGLKGGGR